MTVSRERRDEDERNGGETATRSAADEPRSFSARVVDTSVVCAPLAIVSLCVCVSVPSSVRSCGVIGFGCVHLFTHFIHDAKEGF
jgi:hypothetical protein